MSDGPAEDWEARGQRRVPAFPAIAVGTQPVSDVVSPAMRRLASSIALARRIPTPVRGALWMLTSTASFVVMSVVARRLAADIHPFEVAFFRVFFGLLFILPWLLRSGFAALRTRRLPMHGLRSAANLVSLLAWFVAISLMPLADATALQFTAPLFATVGAALFLAEIVGRRRASAVAVGFAGVLIVLRPGAEAFSPAALLVLACAACTAVEVLSTKVLARTESASAIVLYMGLLMTPLSALPALWVWTPPPAAAWPYLAVLGLTGALGHFSLARAFAGAEATAVLPFDFFKLIFAALLGYVFFGEVPDLWTWIGAAVIFAAALYIAAAETQARRPAAAGESPGAGTPWR